MNTQHTPGPWTIQATSQTIKILGATEPSPNGSASGLVATTSWNASKQGPSSRQLANAKLIAAAPDLLNALELAMATLERVKPSRPCDSTQGTRDVCNVAISKARGQQ